MAQGERILQFCWCRWMAGEENKIYWPKMGIHHMQRLSHSLDHYIHYGRGTDFMEMILLFHFFNRFYFLVRTSFHSCCVCCCCCFRMRTNDMRIFGWYYFIYFCVHNSASSISEFMKMDTRIYGGGVRYISRIEPPWRVKCCLLI